MRSRIGASVAAAAVLVSMSGCGGAAGSAESAGSEESAGCSYKQAYQGVSVSGSAGEPATIDVSGSEPAAELGVLDLCPGDGDAVTQASILAVDYVGVAQSTGVTFDSSFDRGAPATFPVSNVISGWQQGLLGMQEGGTRLLIIPAELAYGAESPGPGIGANETLVFVVDLIDVQ